MASTARLVAAVQGLQGPGSRPVPLRAAHDPDRPTAVVRLTLRAGTTLTRRCELRAAATTWLRRARVFLFLACASRGWLGSIRRPEVTCAADKARRHRRRCECCDEALGAANCGGLVRTLDRRIAIEVSWGCLVVESVPSVFSLCAVFFRWRLVSTLARPGVAQLARLGRPRKKTAHI